MDALPREALLLFFPLLLFVRPSALVGQEERSPERSAPAARDRIEVRGTVVDIETGEPVEGAEVFLGEGRWIRVTNDRGLFAVGGLPAGELEIEVTHVSYLGMVDTLDVSRGTFYEVRVEVAAAAMELEPLTVVATRRTLLDRVGFYERRSSGFGSHMNREEIERRNAQRVSDLFRSFPGARVAPTNTFGDQVVLLRNGCVPAVFVDGIPVEKGHFVDLSLSPHVLEAVEVYRGSQTPPQYLRNSCGTVLFWTREPQRAEGESSIWARLGFIGGIAGLAIFLTR